MKKYSVYVKFKNGQDLQFETDSNIATLQPIEVNGAKMIMTENQYAINLLHVAKIEQVELK